MIVAERTTPPQGEILQIFSTPESEETIFLVRLILEYDFNPAHARTCGAFHHYYTAYLSDLGRYIKEQTAEGNFPCIRFAFENLNYYKNSRTLEKIVLSCRNTYFCKDTNKKILFYPRLLERFLRKNLFSIILEDSRKESGIALYPEFQKIQELELRKEQVAEKKISLIREASESAVQLIKDFFSKIEIQLSENVLHKLEVWRKRVAAMDNLSLLVRPFSQAEDIFKDSLESNDENLSNPFEIPESCQSLYFAAKNSLIKQILNDIQQEPNPNELFQKIQENLELRILQELNPKIMSVFKKLILQLLRSQ